MSDSEVTNKFSDNTKHIAFKPARLDYNTPNSDLSEFDGKSVQASRWALALSEENKSEQSEHRLFSEPYLVLLKTHWDMNQ